MTGARPTGDELVGMLAALANPIRLRIVATLAGGRDYVSHLAREIGVSRPLLHMHLQRLEAVGLIVGHLELSEDGKAMKFYEVADIDLHLTASTLAEAATTLTRSDPVKGPARKERPDGHRGH
jgi:ArsR family transcriptional regulator